MAQRCWSDKRRSSASQRDSIREAGSCGPRGARVEAAVCEVSFGRGALRAGDGADGFLVAISAEGATRWTSVVGEQGDDEVVALATHDGAVHAAANVHRERIGARCGGHVVV